MAAEDGGLVRSYAEKGLSEPERRVELNERLADARYAAEDALGDYNTALALQLDGRSTSSSAALARKVSDALRDLANVHREVEEFLKAQGAPEGARG